MTVIFTKQYLCRIITSLVSTLLCSVFLSGYLCSIWTLAEKSINLKNRVEKSGEYSEIQQVDSTKTRLLSMPKETISDTTNKINSEEDNKFSEIPKNLEEVRNFAIIEDDLRHSRGTYLESSKHQYQSTFDLSRFISASNLNNTNSYMQPNQKSITAPPSVGQSTGSREWSESSEAYSPYSAELSESQEIEANYSMSSSLHYPQLPRRRIVRDFRPRKKGLTIGGFFPLTNTERAGIGIGVKVASDMAVRHITAHPTLLKGYELKLLDEDTQCKASVGTKAFFELMRSDDEKLVLFGGACTEVNEPVAMTAKYWNMIQMSYAESHPKFHSESGTKGAKFPMFYQLVPSGKDLNAARYQFLATFNWTRVGTMVQNDEAKLALVHESFVTGIIKQVGGEVATTESLSAQKKLSIASNIQQLKKKDARIIVADISVATAVHVFCAAHQESVYGADYVWVLSGFHDDAWWERIYNETSKCTAKQFLSALEGHFVMEFAVLRSDHSQTDTGRRAIDYDNEFRKACANKTGCEYNEYHGYAYDGIWVIANALNSFITAYRVEPRAFDPYQFFTNGDKIEKRKLWAKQFKDFLNGTKFNGVTGQVSFRKNQRLGRIRIAQFQSEQYVTIGEYDAATGNFILNESMIHWATGNPPEDRREVRIIRRYLDFGIYIAMVTLTVFGIALAFVFLTLNIYFRNHRFIKMSSPNMNNLIIVGSIISYASVILLGVDTRMIDQGGYMGLCTAKAWFLCFGFTIAFGSIFSKTWRVHSIFTNIKLNKKAIKDYQLFLLVLGLLLVDVVILSSWIGIAPMYHNIRNLTVERSEKTRNLQLQPQVEYCESDHASIFQCLIFGYKGLLLVLGVYLAWETRHVNVPALNDSKYIGISIYIVVIMCSVGVALSFIIKDQINQSYALISIFIICCTTFTLLLVFMPKVIELIRNPKGNNERRYRAAILQKTSTSSMRASRRTKIRSESSSSLNDSAFLDRLNRVQQDNKIWQRLTTERNKDIADLIAQLKGAGEEDLPENNENSAIDAYLATPTEYALLPPPSPLPQKSQEVSATQNPILPQTTITGLASVHSPNASKTGADNSNATGSLEKKPGANPPQLNGGTKGTILGHHANNKVGPNPTLIRELSRDSTTKLLEPTTVISNNFASDSNSTAEVASNAARESSLVALEDSDLNNNSAQDNGHRGNSGYHSGTHGGIVPHDPQPMSPEVEVTYNPYTEEMLTEKTSLLMDDTSISLKQSASVLSSAMKQSTGCQTIEVDLDELTDAVLDDEDEYCSDELPSENFPLMTFSRNKSEIVASTSSDQTKFKPNGVVTSFNTDNSNNICINNTSYLNNTNNSNNTEITDPTSPIDSSNPILRIVSSGSNNSNNDDLNNYKNHNHYTERVNLNGANHADDRRNSRKSSTTVSRTTSNELSRNASIRTGTSNSTNVPSISTIPSLQNSYQAQNIFKFPSNPEDPDFLPWTDPELSATNV